MIMQYERFKKIFNTIIFENSKIVLIEKLAKYPNRYLGLFRPTKPKAKILQNLLQSHEIRFGDAFETLIEEYFKIIGFKILEKRFLNDDNDTLNVDQCFSKNNHVFFIEQKVRDDHDSTKKRGQIDNFEKKLNVLIKKYNEKKLTGIFYFIDPDLKKNKNYYSEKLKQMSKDYGVKLYLFYGAELFELFNQKLIWKEILDYLVKWKEDIPDLPETNFDTESELTFSEIKDLNPLYYRKILENDELFKQIILTIFPEKKTLQLLLKYFKEKSKEHKIYETLAKLLYDKLN